jgi:hypothetical protein
MGAVYRARQVSLDRWVAVKVLDPGRNDPMLREGFLEKFRVEALALARLNDPRIVHVYQAGDDDGRRWFAMELVEGKTLEDRLAETPPLPEREARRIGAEIARALEAAHRCGIVHRDVKPGNVFLRPDGAVKIGDFGLARSPSLESTKLTEVSALACTPAYASPEQLEGDDTDHRSDLYSLGAVLYEMAAQRPPFLAERLAPGGKPPSLRSLRPEFSLAYEDLVARCLAEKPADRFPTYAALLKDLDRDPARAAVTAIPTDAPAAAPPRPSLRGWTRAAAVGLAALVGIFFALVAELGRAAPAPAAPPPPVIQVAAAAIPLPAPAPSSPPAAPLARPAAPLPVETDLAVLRRTLPERRRFHFASALAALGPGPERDRVERAAAAGFPLAAGRPAALVLRDGRTLDGKVDEVGADAVTVAGERVDRAAISPSSFPAGLDPLVRAACGDAVGALAAPAKLDPRHEVGVLDGAIEEVLVDAEAGDFRALKALRPSRALRSSAEPAIGARLRRLDDERSALELREKGELARLLLERGHTIAAARTAAERLAEWRAAIPGDPDLELVGEIPWATWRPDDRHAPGGEGRWDDASRAYVLTARRRADRLWLVKPFEGARRGWELRFRLGEGEGVRLAAALSFTRWVELDRAGISLLRVEGESSVAEARRAEGSGSTLTAIPLDGATLVYVDGRLAFAVPPGEGSLEAGMQVGAGGGTVVVESIRVRDRTR